MQWLQSRRNGQSELTNQAAKGRHYKSKDQAKQPAEEHSIHAAAKRARHLTCLEMEGNASAHGNLFTKGHRAFLPRHAKPVGQTYGTDFLHIVLRHVATCNMRVTKQRFIATVPEAVEFWHCIPKR